MKKDAQIVMNYVNKQDKSKLHFVEIDYFDDEPQEDQSYVEDKIKYLKRNNTLEDRVLEIVTLCREFATFDEKNKFQCRSDANRSTVDIWRIYNNYFRPVSIFTIMRTLYKLVVDENDLETIFCHDIKKQVFCCGSDSEFENAFVVNELGVRFAEWRTIGL